MASNGEFTLHRITMYTIRDTIAEKYTMCLEHFKITS